MLDFLVVAPHSDDEAIGCATLMRRAVADKKRPGVVILTAGDGFPKAAAAAAKKPIDQLTPEDFVALAAMRQRHSIKAMIRVGLQDGDLLFLGYPDAGLEPMYDAKTAAPYRQPFTGKTETYGPIERDYHRTVHGRPGPYLRASVVADLAEIIRNRKPRAIFFTGDVDSHPDHRLTHRYVCDAARAAEYSGLLWTYIVHGDPPTVPPELRITLSDEELVFKRALLESYEIGVEPVHDQLAETYTQSEERFWKVKLPPADEPRRD